VEKREKIKIIASCIVIVFSVLFFIYLKREMNKNDERTVVSVQAAMKMVMEAGYVQGQADALKGIIRVRPINDSTYVWISSPWGTVKTVNDTVSVNIKYK
jgi:hypothetical protein